MLVKDDRVRRARPDREVGDGLHAPPLAREVRDRLLAASICASCPSRFRRLTSASNAWASRLLPSTRERG
jgi:hypothetical protein